MKIRIIPDSSPFLKKKRHWYLFDGGSTVAHGELRGVTLKEARSFALKQKSSTPGTMALARNY